MLKEIGKRINEFKQSRKPDMEHNVATALRETLKSPIGEDSSLLDEVLPESGLSRRTLAARALRDLFDHEGHILLYPIKKEDENAFNFQPAQISILSHANEMVLYEPPIAAVTINEKSPIWRKCKPGRTLANFQSPHSNARNYLEL